MQRQALPPAEALERAVVLSSRYKPEAHPYARDIARMLTDRGIGTHLDLESGPEVREAAANAQLVISVGGDGTILGTARRLAGLVVPTVGINIGKLGFLAEFNLHDVRAYLDGDTDRFRLVPRQMLACCCGDGEPTFALNDAVITQGPMARLLTIRMDVDGQRATRYAADGLVVSTPVGSTAYSLSLGGPLLTPGAEALIVTPIAPHMLTNRSLVLEAQSELRFRVERSVPGLSLVIDGQEMLPLDAATPVVIRRAPQPFLLAAHRDRSFFDVLRWKLYWTRTANYRAPFGPGAPLAASPSQQPPAVVYLHGLFSGPGSRKGRHFAERLRARGVVVELTDLHGEDGPERMTVEAMLERARASMQRARRLAGLGEDGPLLLVGSSFGGWLASLLAVSDPGVAGLLLLAPAFDFVNRFTGRLSPEAQQAAAASGVYDVSLPDGSSRSIWTRFAQEGSAHAGYPEVACPTVVVYGRRDALVPEAVVERFADGRRNVRLVTVEDDHRLYDAMDVIAAELDTLLVRVMTTGPDDR
jgi:NAD+ kinase